VIAPFTDPAFRRALVYLNDLQKEGLLSPSTFTMSGQDYRAILNTQPSVVGLASLGSHTGTWPQVERNGITSIDNNPNFTEMAIIAPFTGPDGVSYTPFSEYQAAAAAQIATRSRNAELAFKVMECFLDPHVGNIARYGEEGVDWSQRPEDLARANPNAFVTMGVFPRLTLTRLPGVNTWSAPNNKIWRNQNPRYATIEMGATNGAIPMPGSPPFDPTAQSSIQQAFNYANYYPRRPQFLLPPLRYTLDETLNIAETISLVNEYVNQSVAEFVTNTRDINNDTHWNNYLRELNNMGLQRWISTSQTAFNRQR
jgi:putative aldouronate transport system substrate-binding protein